MTLHPPSRSFTVYSIPACTLQGYWGSSTVHRSNHFLDRLICFSENKYFWFFTLILLHIYVASPTKMICSSFFLVLIIKKYHLSPITNPDSSISFGGGLPLWSTRPTPSVSGINHLSEFLSEHHIGWLTQVTRKGIMKMPQAGRTVAVPRFGARSRKVRTPQGTAPG